jgi:DNA-binding MarR family transcriptional regulator
VLITADEDCAVAYAASGNGSGRYEASRPATTIDLAKLRSWRFLTNHSLILLAMAGRPEARVADLAAEVGVTERATYRILADLQKGGYITTERVGKRCRRQVLHPVPSEGNVEEQLLADLLELVRSS